MTEVAPPKLSPSVRLKGEQIVLKLGSETTVLEVNTIGSSGGDDVLALIKLLHTRREEVLAKRDRTLLDKWRPRQDDP